MEHYIIINLSDLRSTIIFGNSAINEHESRDISHPTHGTTTVSYGSYQSPLVNLSKLTYIDLLNKSRCTVFIVYVGYSVLESTNFLFHEGFEVGFISAISYTD